VNVVVSARLEVAGQPDSGAPELSTGKAENFLASKRPTASSSTV
jgi:hypothetical protein